MQRALFKLAKSLYRPFLLDADGNFRGMAKINDSQGNYKITFPSGAVIEFSYLTCEKDAIDNFQGAELTGAVFDEFTHFDEPTFNYIRTRMRSESKYPSFIRASMNPHPNHFVKDKYIEPFLINDEDDPLYGVIDKSLNGKLRYYVFDGGQIVSSWNKDDLQSQYPDKPVRSYTVVGSSLSDNKKMLEKNSTYADDLGANDPANAAMLLSGNWMYQPPANGFWDRTSYQEIKSNQLPMGISWCRSYDKAANEPNPELSSYDPDYTASVKVGKDRQGNIYIAGDYIRDEEGDFLMRYRKKVGTRDQIILKQAIHDSERVTVVFPVDPAQSGKFEFTESSKKLIQEGFIVKPDPSPSNKSKAKRFEPFCSACTAGFVYFVEDTFNKKDLDYLKLELENFDGDKNNGYKDDLVDSVSTGFTYMIKKRVYSTLHVPTIDAPTRLANFKNS